MIQRITETRPGLAPGGPRRATGRGTAFRLGEGDEAHAAAADGALPVLAPGLLAIQEDGERDGDRDRRAARRGAAMLEELVGFQADLLRGRADPERLRRLAGLSEGEMPSDPRLAEALAAISLRAKVELARLEVRRRGV
ncbi:flagellar assembly protein FliX [Roseomonas gilardii subsp. gilardii]|uniref:flagellar assembly protein FliX n=1 Tax=Roseomonas gilardii TaxID=257708 RepID=UPI001FF7DB06|nr:flagellar assembly protein FliX [Roseomonas gilardii]UPG71113.1 flagellar assembly protein FliX [Roseomonas gilardii subsp. gilardii]